MSDQAVQSKQPAVRAGPGFYVLIATVFIAGLLLRPMLVLLALGMMSPAVIVLVTVVIAMERLLPKPELIVRLSGIVAVIVGLLMMICRLTWVRLSDLPSRIQIPV
jgi:hypothetical protein